MAESGLRTHADLVALRAAGFDAFLIGEYLMLAPDPAPRSPNFYRRRFSTTHNLKLLNSELNPAKLSSMVRLKICGVTKWEDAKLCADLGAHAIGLNFYEGSPRCVTPFAASEIHSAASSLHRFRRHLR